jgi:hypothetical protein
MSAHGQSFPPGAAADESLILIPDETLVRSGKLKMGMGADTVADS